MTPEQSANLAVMNACIAYADWEESGEIEDSKRFISARDHLVSLIIPSQAQPPPAACEDEAKRAEVLVKALEEISGIIYLTHPEYSNGKQQ